MSATYRVFVNVPHAFTRVEVKASCPEEAAVEAVKVVQRRERRYQRALNAWIDQPEDAETKVKRPKRPFEWRAIVTAHDVEEATVEDGDVDQIIEIEEEDRNK